MTSKDFNMKHLAHAQIIYSTIFSFILPLINIITLSTTPYFLVLSFVYNVQSVAQMFVLYFLLLHIFSHHAILQKSWKTVFLWHGEGHCRHKHLIANFVVLVFCVGVFFLVTPLETINKNANYFTGISSLFYVAALTVLPINLVMRKFFNYSWTNVIISSIISSPIYSLAIIGLIALRL